MTWTCPHKKKEKCKRLNKKCQPLQSGCILTKSFDKKQK